MRVIQRIGNLIDGIVFGVLSLCLKAVFTGMLTLVVVIGVSLTGLVLEETVWPKVIFGFLLVTFNTLACWEYFVKRRASVGLGGIASIIFMVPRAMDLIFNGKERITR